MTGISVEYIYTVTESNITVGWRMVGGITSTTKTVLRYVFVDLSYFRYEPEQTVEHK